MRNQDSFDEKYKIGEQVIDSPPSEPDHGIVKDWDGEESAVRRKIDFILIPILAVAFFALQMDRGNISAVLTSSITKDLNITTNQINIGSQLLSAGIVLSEIPSNIIMQRIGPRVWLSGQLFAWGLVATFQAFVNSFPAYLVTRILLGLCEGGFIPGALYYLSTWYKKDETSLRTSLFFYGQMFASATSSLISAGLLQLNGTHGMEGWRWIFLVEGLITLFIAIVFTLFVPPSAGDGRPLIAFGRWSYFTERESHIIRNRVLLDDPRKAKGHIQISGSDIWQTVKQPRILQHVFVTLVSMTGFTGLTQYTPSMIKGLGFGAVKANALASVPVYCGMVWLIVLSYAAILNVGWLSFYCRTPQERSVAMALVIMAANCAGIAGSQIFRTSDAPRYLHGLTAICSIAGASWVLAFVLGVQYYFRRQKAVPSDSVEVKA
ncbi:hypothetical protein PCG10_008217 [Penicillium crustosum]|uniref:Major facilitator superfamily (MFS) profile domain-containing protein n=1 Tax=Penicillium crustosum TaxID=36656 RepID=A0A9P5GFC6_PENCR|nr:hypothetical protein PCG10_008217 [Penicillium crustosum]